MPILPFQALSELESRILSAPEFQAGLDYGIPRPGHPEGAVKWHIADVLANVDRWYADSPSFSELRLIALVHDAFKYQVNQKKVKAGWNHHGAYARRFAENFIGHIPTLEIIELHDEAYNAWQKGHRDNKWNAAITRATALINRLESSLPLYLAFYRCDNATGDKSQAPYDWFLEITAPYLKEFRCEKFE